MSVVRDLRYLAAWADYASGWLDDAADAGWAAGERLMVSFDAADFAAFRTGLRRVPQLIEHMADVMDRRAALRVIVVDDATKSDQPTPDGGNMAVVIILSGCHGRHSAISCMMSTSRSARAAA